MARKPAWDVMQKIRDEVQHAKAELVLRPDAERVPRFEAALEAAIVLIDGFAADQLAEEKTKGAGG